MKTTQLKIATWILLASLCVSPAVFATATEEFKALYEKEWAFRLAEFPSFATSIGEEGFDDRMGKYTLADEKRRYEFWKGVQDELKNIRCADLERKECINYRIFERQITSFVSGYEFGEHFMPFTSDSGFYTGFLQFPGNTEFKDAADYDRYLSRIAEIPRVMDEVIAVMREGLERGYSQPAVVLTGRDIPIRNQITDSPEASTFYEPFLEIAAQVSDEESRRLREKAQQVVGEGVVPSYQRLLDFMLNEYTPAARASIGLSELPNGRNWYEQRVRHYATVDMSSEEIHQIGKSEVARIRSEMERIINELEFGGSFAEFLNFLRTDPQFYAKTPKELLAEASYFAKKADGRLPSLFKTLPRQPYGIEAVPAEIAPYYTTGRAVPAPLDALKGGYYWVNTHDLNTRPLYNIPALTLHEAAPGHLTQISLAQEQAAQPPFRRNDYISAFGEGWALYAEALGVEMDIYETPYEHFGRLTYEMWRACRLVVDTGMHAMGWTRDQAVACLAENSALSMHNINTEVDRYISWPGQALAYKLGELKIWELRRQAEAALAADFDVRDFHDFILSLGSVPLAVMEDEFSLWLAREKADLMPVSG